MEAPIIQSDVKSTLLLYKHQNPKEDDVVIVSAVYGAYLVQLEHDIKKLKKLCKEQGEKIEGLEEFKKQFN